MDSVTNKLKYLSIGGVYALSSHSNESPAQNLNWQIPSRLETHYNEPSAFARIPRAWLPLPETDPRRRSLLSREVPIFKFLIRSGRHTEGLLSRLNVGEPDSSSLLMIEERRNGVSGSGICILVPLSLSCSAMTSSSNVTCLISFLLEFFISY